VIGTAVLEIVLMDGKFVLDGARVGLRVGLIDGLLDVLIEGEILFLKVGFDDLAIDGRKVILRVGSEDLAGDVDIDFVGVNVIDNLVGFLELIIKGAFVISELVGVKVDFRVGFEVDLRVGFMDGLIEEVILGFDVTEVVTLAVGTFVIIFLDGCRVGIDTRHPFNGQSKNTSTPTEIILFLSQRRQFNDEHPENALSPKFSNESGR